MEKALSFAGFKKRDFLVLSAFVFTKLFAYFFPELDLAVKQALIDFLF